MHPNKSLARFNAVLDTWEQALDQYSESDFSKQPAPDAWSIGQVYAHLLGSAHNFHLKQVEACLASDLNSDKPKTMPGRISYLLGGFLPVKIKVPPSPQYTPPPPGSRAEIRERIAALRPKMTELAQKIAQPGVSKGKTVHPALGYLNAAEWFQLVDMHYRHHLRQKQRLDTFLKNG